VLGCTRRGSQAIEPLSHSADGAKGRRLLVCIAAAIDRRTIARGHVALVRDSAIDVDLATLKRSASGAVAGPTGRR
jgi:hypothetical protein